MCLQHEVPPSAAKCLRALDGRLSQSQKKQVQAIDRICSNIYTTRNIDSSSMFEDLHTRGALVVRSQTQVHLVHNPAGWLRQQCRYAFKLPSKYPESSQVLECGKCVSWLRSLG